jgi:DNA-binding winged helix-turn-helix (wHTH) protein/Tol biopolymer transport system component
VTPPERVVTASVSSISGYSFGAFSIDLRARKLQKGATFVPLPARAFDTLAYLIAHRGRTVDKNEIVGAAWRDVAVTDDSLTHAVSVLRRALGDDPHHPSLIETVPRIGYRFVGAVQPIGEPVNATLDFAGTDSVATEQSSDVGTARARAHPFRSIPLAVGAGLVLTAVAATSSWIASTLTRSSFADVHEPAAIIRLHQLPPMGTTILSGGSVSPSGTDLAFVARDDATGQTALWVRALRSSEAERLPGTEGASKPFWSPDGRSIAFFANDTLSVVGRSGEGQRTIARVGSTAAGGSWGSDNIILFADWTTGVNAVAAAGGRVRSVTQVNHEAFDFAHAWPRFLPDGRHFLYQLISLDPSRSGVYAGSVDSPRTVRVLDVTSPAAYAPPGFVLYVRHDMLMAEGFDATHLTLDGPSVVLARGVSVPPWQEADVISGSRDVLAFREGEVNQRLHVVDRAGKELDTVDAPSSLVNLRLSPNQRQLMATSAPTDAGPLWIIDLERRQFTRIASEAIAPVWAPDGEQVAFTARGGFDLYVGRKGDPPGTPLVSDSFAKVLNDWSSNAREIVYSQIDPSTKLDLWQLPSTGGAARPLLKTPFNESQGRISPDGRWIAYLSDQSGRPEIYVRRYPEMTDPRRVSVGGGAQAQWRRDQSELFYLTPDNALMAVAVNVSDGISFGPPRRLFQTSLGFSPSDTRDSYAVTANGESFLLPGPIGASQTSRISVMINWTAGLTPSASQGFAPRRLVAR